MKSIPDNLPKHDRYWQDKPNQVGHSEGEPTHHIKTIHSTTEIPSVHRSWDQATEEAVIISQSMSNWASPILVMPKKQDCMDMDNPQGSNNGKFNMWLCINYRKLKSHIQTACQIKADSSLGYVISSYPVPTIDSILVHCKSYKYFSSIDLRSDYYQIKLGKEAAEKTVFITDKGK